MVNQRLPGPDVCRAVAIIGMVAVHSQQLLLFKEERKSTVGALVTFFGGAPAAPMFLFLMGYFFAARGGGSSFMELLRRATLLLVLGYLLNFLRSVGAGWLGAPLPGDLWAMAGMIDILQLAAPTLLFLWMLQQFPTGVSWVVFWGIVIGSPFLYGLTPRFPLFDFLWGKGEFVFFPFFPWAAYSLFGFLWHSCTRPWWILVLAILMLCLGGASVSLVRPGELGFTYYHPHWVSIIWILGFVVVWFELFSRTPWPRRLVDASTWLSQRVTSLYFFSWIWITICTVFLGYRNQSMATMLSGAVLCFGMACLSSWAWGRVPLPRILRL